MTRSIGLARGESIPDNDILLRYASPNRTHKSDDGSPTWLMPDAFKLRDDETYLSLTWVEFFEGTHDSQIRAAVAEFRKGIGIRQNGAFGMATAGAIRAAGNSVTPAHQLRILHEPEDLNRAHVAVHRYPRDNAQLREALVRLAFTRTLHAKLFME